MRRIWLKELQSIGSNTSHDFIQPHNNPEVKCPYYSNRAEKDSGPRKVNILAKKTGLKGAGNQL